MKENNPLVKTLWLLMYHTGQADPKGTTGHLEFFYAVDDGEARAAADEFKLKHAEEIGENIYEEYLEPQEHGFTVHRTILSGKIELNTDGTLKTLPYAPSKTNSVPS